MKKTKMFKRAVSFSIALLMIFSSFFNLTGNYVFAEDGEIQWDNPGAVKLTKSEQKTNEGRWKIDLKVEGRNIERKSDVVLVIDRSGSMGGDKITNTKNAAKAFVNKLLTAGDTNTRIALVTFNDTATKVTTEFKGFSSKNELLNAIDLIEVDWDSWYERYTGGTYIQAGIEKAQELLSQSPVGTAKNIVLFGDGEPTYSKKVISVSGAKVISATGKQDKDAKWDFSDITLTFDSYKVGSGNAYDISGKSSKAEVTYTYNKTKYTTYYPPNNGVATIYQAKLAKDSGIDIYSIALNAGANGEDVLKKSSSGVAEYYYAVTNNTSVLDTAFTKIAGKISYAAKDAIVTDPMGDMFDLANLDKNGDFTWALAGTAEANTADIVISQGEIISIGNTHPYTIRWEVGDVIGGTPATMTYYVDIKSQALAGTQYPTNQRTFMEYENVNGRPTTKDFDVPQVTVGNSGSIKIVAYAVDDNGNPLNDNGTIGDRVDLAKKLGEVNYLKDGNAVLPFGNYTVETDVFNNLLQGYVFSSESVSNGGNANPTNVIINASKQNHTVYFGYKEGKYTVTYDKNSTDVTGQVPTDSTKYIYNQDVTVKGQNNLVRQGYTFNGWNTEADGSGTLYAVDATFKMPANNVTLYAQWLEKGKVTINYEATEGGSVSVESESINPEIGEPEGSTATAVEGYKFVKWTDEDGNKVSDNVSFKPNKEDGAYVSATYTAHFEPIEVSYTVNYLNAKDNSPLMDSKEVTTRKYKDIVTETAEIIAGYTADAQSKGLTLLLTENVINFYYTELNHITINYEANEGGSVSVENESVNPEIGDPKGSTATANAGYTFVKWTDENGNKVSDNVSFRPNKEDGVYVSATYTAHFEPNTDLSYTVKYVNENGDNLLAPVVREGKTFNETYEETAEVITGYTADAQTKNIKVDAYGKVLEFVYTIDTHNLTVNYVYEDGTTAATSHTETLNYNGGYSVNSPVIEGYTADKLVVSGTMGTEDVVVTVVYTKDNAQTLAYTVNYYKDGNLFDSENGTVPVHTPVVSSVSDKTPDGYVEDNSTSTTLPFIVTASNNVIEVYYVKDSDRIVQYTVNHIDYDKNEIIKTVTQEGKFGEIVTEWALDDEAYKDYNVNLPVQTLSLELEGNVINFYYSLKETEIVQESHVITWKYETGYSTSSYVDRYQENNDGKANEPQYYVNINYDLGYTYSRSATRYEYRRVDEPVMLMSVTSGSGITTSGSGITITGSAIKVEKITFIDLFYDMNIYKIIYKIVGDHFATDNYKTELYTYGETVAPLTNGMGKEGYTFSGWSIVPETMPAGDVVVTGSYTKDNPVGPVDPVDPVDPTDPTDPTDTVDPTDPVDIDEEEIPGGPATTEEEPQTEEPQTEEPQTEEPQTEEEIIVEEEQVPGGALPHTAGVTAEVFYGLGSLALAIGALLKRKSNKK